MILTPAGQQQVNDWWMPGSGNPYLNQAPARGGWSGTFSPGGSGGFGVYGLGGGRGMGMYGGYGQLAQPGRFSPGLSRGPSAQQQQMQMPDYSGGMGWQNYGQGYGNYMNSLNYGQSPYYQPPQQIGYTAAPIASRPTTYRPIAFGSYSRF